jgi:8-oxo-dGTP pyrophosphatase MutT (NUDIX family)
MSRNTEPYRPEAATVPELAAGVVIFRESDDKVFLMHLVDEDRWCLPKGHVDPGESLATAALREVREEAGFEHIELDGELREVAYRFYHPRRALNIHKTVVYFLGRTAETAVRLEPIFDRSEWVEIGEAVGRAKYDTDREVLEAARRLRSEGPAPVPARKFGK